MQDTRDKDIRENEKYFILISEILISLPTGRP
jgi:hypothetical protein